MPLYDKHFLFHISFVILLTCFNLGRCQSEANYRSNRFSDFLDLFNTIQEKDSTLAIQDIEYASYPQKIIDTSFDHLINRVPFFYPYATFKIICDTGFLVCIHHVCPAEYSDFRFVELITYDVCGVQKNSVALPYMKNGCITEPNGNEYRSELYVSNKKIRLIVNEYNKKKNSSKSHENIFLVGKNGIPNLLHNKIPIVPELQSGTSR